MNASVVRRLYEATASVATTAYQGEYTDQLLARLGIPGLVCRLELKPASSHEASFLPALKFYHTLLREGAQEISDQLTRSGVDHFFAKGVALLGSIYRPGDRFVSDIDLYVPLEQRAPALDVLQRLRYVELPERDQAGPVTLRSALILEREAPSEVERLIVDLHWGLNPVERLLPRRNRPVPEKIWSHLDTTGPLRVPSPEHHAAILVHHLVQSDLLHVRSLLDLALVFGASPEPDVAEYLATCRMLRIGRFANWLLTLLHDEFGLEVRSPPGEGPAAWNRFTRDLTLHRWLAFVARTYPDDDSVITVRRILRRLQLIDAGGAGTLFGDLLLPPKAFLEWRWGADRLWMARLRHCGQIVRKALHSNGISGKR